MRFYFWFRALVSGLFVPRLSRAPRRRERRTCGFESLETRAVFASYSLTNASLNIALNQANERVSVFANGTSYLFRVSTAATNTWTLSGTLPTGHSITNSGTDLTTANLGAFSSVNITDSAANTSVYFETGSNGTFSDNFNINLDNLSNSVLFNGTNTFNGTNSLSVTIDSRAEVPSAKSLTMTNGNLDMSINMQATPQVLSFSGLMVNNGTIQTTGTGVTNITARGGIGASTSYLDRGIAVINGGKILGGTTGTMNLTGYGYTGVIGTVQGQGVLVYNVGGSSTSTISSIGANVSVTGYGANSTNGTLGATSDTTMVNAGVMIGASGQSANTEGGLISSGGSGFVTITGYGGTLVNQTTIRDAYSLGVQVGGSNATISSGGSGLVTVTGTGGGAPANTACGMGVSVFNGLITSGTNGSVAVTGSGGISQSRDNHGVHVQGATGKIAAGVGSGATTVNGTGGGCGTSYGDFGVNVTSNATISSLGSGNVNVTGTGGASSGNGHRGVVLSSQSTMTSNGGDVFVTGYGGGTGASADNYGYFSTLSGTVSAGGLGNVTVYGYGGNNNGTGNNNNGVLVDSGGGNETPSGITSGGGNVTVCGTGGGGVASSANASSSNNNTGVIARRGGYITAQGSGTVSVTGQGGGRSPGSTGVFNVGVWVSDTNVTGTNASAVFGCITSAGGAVTVTGYGGGGSGTACSSTSSSNFGVYVFSGGCITSGGDADVTVNGIGGGFGSTSGNNNNGVFVNGTSSTSGNVVRSTITSGGNGTVTIIGQGTGAGSASTNHGVRISGGAQVSSGGQGDVTVNGTGGLVTGASNYGVSVSGVWSSLSTTLTSGGGNITVNGYGGGSNSNSGSNFGVDVSSGGQIAAPGNAGVQVTGRGGDENGTGGGSNFGIQLDSVVGSFRPKITSNNGPVTLIGYGGQTNTTVSSTSSSNIGVVIARGACVSSGGSFPVNITGYGGGLGKGVQSNNNGVLVNNQTSSVYAQITSAGGPVNVIGIAGGTNGSGTTNHGIAVQIGGLITSTGNGTAVTLTGTGGGNTNATSTNHGIYLAGCSTASNLTVTSNNGPISITGSSGSGSNSQDISTASSAVIGNAAALGNVTIHADSASFATATGSAINASPQLTIIPRTAGVGIDLGSTTGAANGPLALSAAEIATLNAPSIQLGNSSTGNVTLTNGVTFPTASNVTLHSNGTNSVLSATACATQGMTLGAGKSLDVSTLPIIASSIGGTSLGLGYTKLKVVGDLSIAGKTLSLSGAYTPTAGNVFTIVEATNLTGTFTGLADGSTTTFKGRTLVVNYTSTSVTLTDPAPLVTTDPTNSTLLAGATATFTAAASGTPTPTVQWQVSPNAGTSWSDITGATSATLSFTAAAADNGKIYRAVFTNSYAAAMTNAASLTVESAPSITTQPSNQTVTPGDTATFTSAASGNPTPTVQWQSSIDNGTTWSDITGATNTTYSFTTAAGDTGNQYRAVFTNTAGTVTTSAATLTVNSGTVAPAVTGNPADSTVTAGSSASFTASASGNPAPTVKWQVSTNAGTTWSDIAGATTTTYSFTAAASDNAKQYRAVFTNGVGSDATTTAATLTVQVAPTITSGNSATFAAGLSESFQVVATGNPAATYAVTSGSLPSGVTLNPTTGALSGKAALGTAGSYAVTISANNGVGTAATQAFTLTVVNQLASVQISKGQVQRSYLRYIDLAMANGSVATQLAGSASTRMKLIMRDLNGNNPSEMSLSGLVSASGSTVGIDFGAPGIGGARNTNAADGYYTLQLDMDSDGTYETTYNFYRLFGDTNGDGKVDQTDVNNVTAGLTAYSVEYDLNFDGRVNSTDALYVKRALNRSLNSSLPLG